MTFFNNLKLCTRKIYLQINTHNKIYKKLIPLLSVSMILYFSFYCPSTKFTQEGLINSLSHRNPPNWLMPSHPGESIDIELTKNYKRLKLMEFRKKTVVLQLDIKELFEKNKSDNSSRYILRDDLSAVVSTLAEFWAITIVTDQDHNEKIIVGKGSQPINLNDRVLRWQTEIEAAADKYHLEPALIAAVIEQESGGEPESLSSVGAIGLMQLMPSTAELMGVNPYDTIQNIDGGAHYLQLQLESFGDVQIALAAYNAGPGEVENGHWIKIPETIAYVEKVPVLIRKYEQIWQEHSEKSQESQDVRSTL
ncbi:lytic transglycosylase domain-containing protein [Desulfitobacterium sp.]|uniref:lytic transglycosylase domain-containing protein n=1 Tax=Desulfitobacterium sp. TaxID=49981 RepID=UPI002BFEDFE2|nr:lytic transglycosylase domain-containing protein [Desulfitobacterium sp.]HVJ48062.1 lytic transglycosylase domain-containing protein [Desulfitobacterium sp.]